MIWTPERIKTDGSVSTVKLKTRWTFGKVLRPTNWRFFYQASQHLRIWGILQYFHYGKTINMIKNFSKYSIPPFCELPSSLKWWCHGWGLFGISRIMVWYSSSSNAWFKEKRQLLFYAQKSWFIFNKTMCHSQKENTSKNEKVYVQFSLFEPSILSWKIILSPVLIPSTV